MRYEAIKRERIKSRFTGFEPWECFLWYNVTLKKWEEMVTVGPYDYSSHQSCKSIRAFRRKLKKAPKGVKFVLWSRFVNHRVFVTNK